MADIKLDEVEWFFQTSETIGLQAPLRSLNKESLTAAAFSLGIALSANSPEGYSWIDFCKWTPNEEFGMEEHIEDTYQLAFTQYGAAVIKQWDTIFVPFDAKIDCPVLVYNYDAFCYRFCDASHFLPKNQAWTLFAKVFDIVAPPIAEPAPGGEFLPIIDYMRRYDLDALDESGIPIRPKFHN